MNKRTISSYSIALVTVFIILSSLISPNSAKAGTVISSSYHEDFEKGAGYTLSWVAGPNSSCSRVQGYQHITHSGNYSARMFATGKNSYAAGLIKLPSGFSEYTVEGWLYIKQRTELSSFSVHGFVISGSWIGWKPVASNASYVQTHGMDSAHYKPVGLPISSWNHVKVTYYVTDATISIWVNNKLLHSRIKSNKTPGEVPEYGLGAVGTTNASDAIEQYYDDISATPGPKGLRAFFTVSTNTPKTYEEILLDASSSEEKYPGRYIVSYKWEFFDSAGRLMNMSQDDSDKITKFPQIFYIWNKQGSYTVKLTVQNDTGVEASYYQGIIVQGRNFWDLYSVPNINRDQLENIVRELNIQVSSVGDFGDRKELAAILCKPVRNDKIILHQVADAKKEAKYTYAVRIAILLGEMNTVDDILSQRDTRSLVAMINAYLDHGPALEILKNISFGMALDALGSMGLVGLTISKGLSLGGKFIGIGNGVTYAQQQCPSLEFWRTIQYNNALWRYFNHLRDGHLQAWEMAKVELKTYPEDEKATLGSDFYELGKVYGDYSTSSGLTDELKEQVKATLKQEIIMASEQYKFEPLYDLVTIKSPCELRVYNSIGNVTGVINTLVKNDIPNAVYDEAKEQVVILNPGLDNYNYCIVGKDAGSYGLEITRVVNSQSFTIKANTIPITPYAIHSYSIDWNTLYKNGAGVKIKIDANKDGIFETSFVSGNSITQDVFPKFIKLPYSPQSSGALAQTALVQPTILLPNVVIQSALLSNTKVNRGSPVTISVNAVNKGTSNGSCKITLSVNGAEDSSQCATLDIGECKLFYFTINRTEPGTYSVYVNGVSAGSFIVEELLDANVILFASTAAIVLSVLGLIIFSKRRHY